MKKLSQRSLPWRDDKLGTCRETIGSHGCAITCIAMLAGVTPEYVNNRMRDNGGYTNGCLVNWGRIPELFPLEYLGKGSKPTHTPTIANVLARTVYSQPTQHFVIWYNEDTIIDPWTGTQTSMRATRYQLVDFRNMKQKITNPQEDMTTQEIRAMLTAIARQYNKGDIFDPAKGAWIDIDHYIRRYNEEPTKDKVIDEMLDNIDDIKVQQGIHYLDAKKRTWVKL